MKVIFIIENMLGVTGGNITLNKIIKYLVCRGLDILILTRTSDYVPIDGVRVSTIPLHESFSKNCPKCDIVIATYFSHVHELIDIKANKKIYYAQGDQFVFNDPMLIDERNPALSVNKDLHKLSSMSYGIEGIIYILN